MSFTAGKFRACVAHWMAEELSVPDEAMRLVLRRRARDFGSDGGGREFLESFAMAQVGVSEQVSAEPVASFVELLNEATRWASEASEITRGVSQLSAAQMDFGVESLVLLRRALDDALRLGAANEERVQHALWWKMHLLGDDERSRFWHWKGRVREVRPGLSREAAHARRDVLRAELGPWRRRATATLEAALRPAVMRLRARLFAEGWLPVESGRGAITSSEAAQAPVPYNLLEVPDPISKRSGKVSPWAIRCSFPTAVAAHAAQIIASGTRPEHVVLLMPPDAPPHAWADHTRALTHAGVPYSAPWGPAWRDMLLVRAWSKVLAFADAPESPLARYALLVGPTFGAPDTLALDALDSDLQASLTWLSDAASHGALALFDAWVTTTPITVVLEHLHGAAWLRRALGLIRAELLQSSRVAGDTARACAADFQDGLRRDWSCSPGVPIEGAARLVRANHYVAAPDDVVFVCEPTTARLASMGATRWSHFAPRAWVVASVQGAPVEGWGSAVAQGDLRAIIHAATLSGPALGELVRTELLRAGD